MNGTASPRVSVLMTTYNGGRLVQETIDSIRAQTFKDWELIVVDDCSTDDTYEIVTAHAEDPRIRLFRNDRNLGISLTRNRALELARGEYVAATDQDDLSLPQRVAAQVGFLDENPRVVMLATAAKELRGATLRPVYPGEMRSHLLAWRLYTRCSIVHSSVCMRRKALIEHGLRYEPEFHYAEDFVLFHKLAQIGDIKILPDELVIYRETADNASSRHGAAMNANGMAFLRQAYAQELGITAAPEAFAQLWSVFNAGAPARTEQVLQTAGRLYADALQRFCERRPLTDGQAREIQAAAGTDWWRAVAAHCVAQGRPRALPLFRSIEALSGQAPPALPLMAAYGKAWLTKGRKLMGSRVATSPV